MAWNPSPEVQVARDAAKAMSTASGLGPIDRCIVFYTTESGKFGYASYGTDKPACGEARRLADAMAVAAYDHMGKEW